MSSSMGYGGLTKAQIALWERMLAERVAACRAAQSAGFAVDYVNLGDTGALANKRRYIIQIEEERQLPELQALFANYRTHAAAFLATCKSNQGQKTAGMPKVYLAGCRAVPIDDAMLSPNVEMEMVYGIDYFITHSYQYRDLTDPDALNKHIHELHEEGLWRTAEQLGIAGLQLVSEPYVGGVKKLIFKAVSGKSLKFKARVTERKLAKPLPCTTVTIIKTDRVIDFNVQHINPKAARVHSSSDFEILHADAENYLVDRYTQSDIDALNKDDEYKFDESVML